MLARHICTRFRRNYTMRSRVVFGHLLGEFNNTRVTRTQPQRLQFFVFSGTFRGNHDRNAREHAFSRKSITVTLWNRLPTYLPTYLLTCRSRSRYLLIYARRRPVRLYGHSDKSMYNHQRKRIYKHMAEVDDLNRQKIIAILSI